MYFHHSKCIPEKKLKDMDDIFIFTTLLNLKIDFSSKRMVKDLETCFYSTYMLYRQHHRSKSFSSSSMRNQAMGLLSRRQPGEMCAFNKKVSHDFS